MRFDAPTRALHAFLRSRRPPRAQALPPVSAPDSIIEARVLDYLHGRLPVATPELAAAWPAIPGPHQGRVASQAGELLAALHALDAQPLHPVLGPPDWGGFLAGQRATARQRQREVNLPDPWLSQIESFLASVPLTRAGAGAAAHRGDPRAP
jgi:hygromycin-B 7''-O-kinase